MEDNIIKIRKLSKRFGTQEVLKELDLDIPKGQITVIIGRSGGGKSVLLKHIIGLLKPDSGEILIDGIDIAKEPEDKLNEVRKRFGMLFQEGALFDSMTIEENVAFPLLEHTNLSDKEIEERTKEVLAMVGLIGAEKKYPSEISGGMRKRAGLARAIIAKPDIILFDEPTSGLDPIMSAHIDNLIVDIQKRLNVTCIIISHDIQSTFRIAHKIAMLYDGKIIAEGTPDVMRTIDNPYLRQFIEGSSQGPIQVVDNE
ncbi:MAG: ABC transporter ATP-binding protein [Proteobacteria bacterium]|nr:ABC transporter ATP-binding protein [Pseudomonadota bacterium]